MSEEQEKLSRRERRAQAKTGDSKSEGAGGVKDRNQKLRADAAGRRRRARQEERSVAASEGLDAGERVDDALVRGSAATSRFLRSNFVWLQWVVIAGLVGAMGYLVFNYRKSVTYEEEGSRVASVLAAQFGRITSTDPIQLADARMIDPRKEYSSFEEQAKAASGAWQRLNSAPSQGLKLLGRLGRAGALYDQGKHPEAREAFQAVLASPQIALHPQLKGRAIEGKAFTLEAEEKLDEALKIFEKLKNLDLPEFEKLATFHIARVEFLRGNKKRAIELLTKLDTELSKGAGPEGPNDYVGAAVRDLLKTADPSRAKEEQKAISAAQMAKFMKQFEDMQKKRGTAGTPSIPGLPSPLPSPTPPPAVDSSSEDDGSSDDTSAKAPIKIDPTPSAPAPSEDPPAPKPSKTPSGNTAPKTPKKAPAPAAPPSAPEAPASAPPKAAASPGSP